MALLRLPYVRTYRDRHGRLRRYLRRRGHPDVPLPGEIGSEEFMRAYKPHWAHRRKGQVLTRPVHLPGWSRTTTRRLNSRTSNHHRVRRTVSSLIL